MKRFASWLVAATCLVDGTAQAQTTASRACEMFKSPRGSFMVVVDESLKIVDSDVLDLGEIDFSKTRSVDHKYFVVSSKNIDSATGLGGEEMRPSLSDAEAACAKVNVKAIDFDFDGSSLPSGRFEQPLSIYRDDPSLPAMESKVRRVTGVVKRVWFTVTAQPGGDAKLPAFVVRLTNSGNVASMPLSFELPSKAYFTVARDDCEGRTLAPSQNCELVVQVKPGQLPSQGEEFEVPIVMEGSPYTDRLWFNWHGATLKVFATNR